MATVNIEVTDQMREDQLTTALEGGSNYWYFIGEEGTNIVRKYQDEDEPFATAMFKALKTGEKIPIHELQEGDDDMEEGELLGHISTESMDKGEQLMADRYRSHFIDMIDEKGDAETADVWFQLAVMGELVYG